MHETSLQVANQVLLVKQPLSTDLHGSKFPLRHGRDSKLLSEICTSNSESH